MKAASSESSRGSPIPSKTNAPWLRSTEPSESSWAYRCTAGKGDLGIFITPASTAEGPSISREEARPPAGMCFEEEARHDKTY